MTRQYSAALSLSLSLPLFACYTSGQMYGPTINYIIWEAGSLVYMDTAHENIAFSLLHTNAHTCLKQQGMAKNTQKA